uniref:Uncharacterized protein n=1 Tax=Rhizophora mucronata TaxID=61149 RepID=A0A2P2N704_RHIMU
MFHSYVKVKCVYSENKASKGRMDNVTIMPQAGHASWSSENYLLPLGLSPSPQTFVKCC